MKPKAADKTVDGRAMDGKVSKQDALKAEALSDALAAIHKNHGDGSIMRMGDRRVVPIEGISTGSLGLDLCTGGVGFPRGRVIEVYGPESSGKTTLTLHVVANAQRAGGTPQGSGPVDCQEEPQVVPVDGWFSIRHGGFLATVGS